MKIKSIIIDDERRARGILRKLLASNAPNVEVVEEAGNLKDGVELIRQCNPDVVFLDIDMPNYAGHEIGKFFDKIDFEIIFVTAYDSFAIKAFEMAAIDYLLKPIDISRLNEAVDKLTSKLETRENELNYKVLLDSLENKESQTIVVSFKGNKKAIKLSEIVAVEASSAYSIIHTKSGEEYLYSRNLKFFEDLFEDMVEFFRSHKSWIINTKSVSSFSKSKLIIQLDSGIEAKLSKFKKGEFIKLV
ncbi:MAG: response regulator transcription factor [Crocinitomicaceae bacterium]|nr:response regulator transcription factor [Crocinitomicaceae bacterium]